jgi:hypothetical protein
MPQKSLPDEIIGEARLRIVIGGALYRGCVLRGGKSGEALEDSDLERLRHRLREEAGRLHPDYCGFHGAVARFRSFYAQGFAGPEYEGRERGYKVAASELLRALLPLERAENASAEEAAALTKVVSSTNLLAHQHEQQHMREILGSRSGPDLVRAAARLAGDEIDAGLASMRALESKTGRISWPIATYLPFLWAPETNMFLKPAVTQDFATRVGHPLAEVYDAALEPEVYRSLLDLAAQTECELAVLAPQDRIDVQSFIWVVGKYSDAERGPTKLAADAGVSR